jgi:aerobic-type carbon monoxide dehydrogenase small subunit (CoxS/CutS family)
MLLWVLRTDLGLTGTKYGCGKAMCGACTVIVNDRAVQSCMTTIRSVKGKNVLTIEGLSKNGKLHPIQEAFVKHDALQCGFCTPGMILNAYSLLMRNPEPTREEIIEGMEDNLCRCGAHIRIIRAIETASQEMKGAS